MYTNMQLIYSLYVSFLFAFSSNFTMNLAYLLSLKQCLYAKHFYLAEGERENAELFL